MAPTCPADSSTTVLPVCNAPDHQAQRSPLTCVCGQGGRLLPPRPQGLCCYLLCVYACVWGGVRVCARFERAIAPLGVCSQSRSLHAPWGSYRACTIWQRLASLAATSQLRQSVAVLWCPPAIACAPWAAHMSDLVWVRAQSHRGNETPALAQHALTLIPQLDSLNVVVGQVCVCKGHMLVIKLLILFIPFERKLHHLASRVGANIGAWSGGGLDVQAAWVGSRRSVPKQDMLTRGALAPCLTHPWTLRFHSHRRPARVSLSQHEILLLG